MKWFSFWGIYYDSWSEKKNKLICSFIYNWSYYTLYFSTADTLDLTFAGDGATFSAGKIRVYAILADVSDMGQGTGNGFNADEVDRDTLA